jgi:hypothetical protein
MTLFVPESQVVLWHAHELLRLTDEWRGGCIQSFREVGYLLLEFDQWQKHGEAGPSNFTDDAFETYLIALATEGYAYYLSVTELLAVAEGVRANVVVVRRSEGMYIAIGRYLGGVGDVAVVVLEGGEQRGHFSRLCDGRLVAGADAVRRARRQRTIEQERWRARELAAMRREEHAQRTSQRLATSEGRAIPISCPWKCILYVFHFLPFRDGGGAGHKKDGGVHNNSIYFGIVQKYIPSQCHAGPASNKYQKCAKGWGDIKFRMEWGYGIHDGATDCFRF